MKTQENTSSNEKKATKQKIVSQKSKEDEDEEALILLTLIKEKLEEISDFSLNSTNFGNQDREKPEKKMRCISCLSEIEKGDLMVAMPCCGGICHLYCLPFRLNFKNDTVLCSNCLSKLPSDFLETVNSIVNVMNPHA